MKINNTSNTGFKGTFILNPQSARTREAIPNIIKKGRQLFYNIKNEGNIVIVTKDRFDNRVRDFIESNELNFEYYPEISTKSGLDDQEPLGLKKLLQIKNNCVVKSLELLNKFLSPEELHLSKQCEYIHEALNTLRLNIENAKIEIDKKGLFVVRDGRKNRTIKSTGFRNGGAYFCIIPDSVNESIQRFFINKNGKELVRQYTTPSEMISFNKAFNKAVETN